MYYNAREARSLWARCVRRALVQNGSNHWGSSQKGWKRLQVEGGTVAPWVTTLLHTTFCFVLGPRGFCVQQIRYVHSGLLGLQRNGAPDSCGVSVGRPQIAPRHGLACPITRHRSSERTTAAAAPATSTSHGAAQVARMVDLIWGVHHDPPGHTRIAAAAPKRAAPRRTSARPTSMASALQATPPLDPPKSCVGRCGWWT